MYVKSLQLRLTLCDPMDCRPQGKNTGVSCHGNLPNSGIEPTSLTSPALAGGFFTTRVTRAALISAMSEYSHIVTYTEIPKYATISSPKLSVQNALLMLIFGLSFHNLDGWERGLGGKYKKDRIYIYISLTYRCYDSSSATRRT